MGFSPSAKVDRKWSARNQDIRNGTVLVVMHLLALCAPFQFNWPALVISIALGLVTVLLGITLSYHRNLTHRSFKLPKWLEYTFAYCGALALQGDPIEWVSNHRYHHQFVDSERDLHSPREGFWFSHMGWLYNKDLIIKKRGRRNNVVDLEKQSFYKWLRRTYFSHQILLGAILYALGGLPFVVWGMGVRVVYWYHVTFMVNSVCHIWGKQVWNTGDLSKNNWWVAILSFGEGWHNNHHAFEYSARHGLQWWQLDVTWYLIKFLQTMGLATNVKLPSEVHKRKLAFELDD